MEFKKILAVILGIFGISALAKGADGKAVLSAEQEKELKDQFGEKFLEKFKNDLKAEESKGVDLTVPSSEITALQQTVASMNTQLNAALGKIKILEADKAKLETEKELDDPEKIDMTLNNGKKAAFKPNMSYQHNKVIDAYFKTGNMQYSGDDTINTSELQDEFGKYVSGVKVDIFQSLKQELTITQYMTTVTTDKTEWRAAKAIMDSVLQQFTPKWTPKGTSTFSPITIKNFKLKVNVPITPSDIIDQFIGYLYDENLTPDQMPIVKYIVDVLLIPQLGQDLENAMSTGKYVEHVQTQDNAAGSAAEDSMDGVVTILQALSAKHDNSVTWLLDGVELTPANIIEKMNLAADSVAPLYKKKKMLIHADPDLILIYQRAYQKLYPTTKNQDAGNLRLDFTNLSFAPVDGLIGTGVFFITPKENFIHLMSRNTSDAKIFLQVANYDVKVFMEFWKGIGFAMEEAIFAYLPEDLSGSGSNGGGL
jgi:hypothetical protein